MTRPRQFRNFPPSAAQYPHLEWRCKAASERAPLIATRTFHEQEGAAVDGLPAGAGLVSNGASPHAAGFSHVRRDTNAAAPRAASGVRTHREGNQSAARGTKDAQSFVIVRDPTAPCGTWQAGGALQMQASGLSTSPTLQLTVGRPPSSGLAGLYTLVLEKHRYPIIVRLTSTSSVVLASARYLRS